MRIRLRLYCEKRCILRRGRLASGRFGNSSRINNLALIRRHARICRQLYLWHFHNRSLRSTVFSSAALPRVRIVLK